jgi:uncharacterized protein involved in type VI secretion and phage assembly
MHRLVHTIQQIARHEVEQQAAPALAVVKSVHGANGTRDYSCTVQLRDSGIVLPHVPIATQVIGHASLPRQHDLVVVAFAGGDLNAPIVIGRLYNEEVAPPKNAEGELVTVLPGDEDDPTKRLEIRVSTPGDGTRSLVVKLAGSGVTVELSVDDESISLKAQDTSLELRQSGASDGVAVLKAGDAKVTVKQSGDVSVETTGKLTLKASDIEIKADSSVKIKGATVDIN